MKTLEHLLCKAIAGPTGNCGAKIDLSPFGMTGRDKELIPIGEKPLREAFDAAVSIASFRPIEYGKNRRHRDSIDRLPIRE